MTKILEICLNRISKAYVVEMRLKNLDQLPPIHMPEDFYASTLKPGHEQDYIDVMRKSLKEGAASNWFRQNFSKHLEYDPENLILIYREKMPVAAAASWQIKRREQWIGHLKDVGVVQDFWGRGLGRQVSLIALHRLRERGFNEVMLKTHDYRLRAIQLYLSIGFKPQYKLWAGKRRWKRILKQLEIRGRINE